MTSNPATALPSDVSEEGRRFGNLRAMIPSFLLSQGDKMLTALGMIVVALGGKLFIASAGDDWEKQVGAGSLIALGSAVAVAFYKNRASTITALSQSKAAEAATLEAATNALIKRITDANDKQVAQLNKDLDYARARADTAEQIQHQERVGKHDAIEQLYAVVLHSHLLEEILRSHSLEVPEGPKIEFGRAVRSQDAKTERLLSDRVDSSKRTTTRIDIPAVVQIRYPKNKPAVLESADGQKNPST